MKLPPPRSESALSVEHAIQQRRTVRSFRPQALHLDQFSQLLWAAQGITGARGFKRAAPSAGALFPMDLYAALGMDSVASMTAGIYHYGPDDHTVSRISGNDIRESLAKASLSQMWMAKGPLQLVITAEYSRVTAKYGNRGRSVCAYRSRPYRAKHLSPGRGPGLENRHCGCV